MTRQTYWDVLPCPAHIVVATAGLNGNCLLVTLALRTGKYWSTTNIGVHVLSISEL